MPDIQIVIDGVSGPAMTRELARRVNDLDLVKGEIQHKPAEPGTKSIIGQATAAVITIIGENAITPLLELLGTYLKRDRRGRIKMKFADGTELELESETLQDDLRAVSKVLRDKLKFG